MNNNKMKKKIKKNITWKWVKNNEEIKHKRITITNSNDGSTYGRAWDYRRNAPANNTSSVTRRSRSNSSRSSSSGNCSKRRK